MDNLSGSATAASITADISLLNQSIEHITSVITSLETLGKEKPWSQLGYFDAARHDEIEHLFFRFLISRRVLVSLDLHESNTDSHQQQNHNNNKSDGTFDLQRALARAESSFADPNITDTTHALRTMIILASAMALLVSEGKFVKCFAGDKIAIAKLNEKFYRSDIDFNTYDNLKLECTDPSVVNGRVQSLTDAYNNLYLDEHANNDVYNMTIRSLQAQELSKLIESLAKEANDLVQEYTTKQSKPFLLRDKLKHLPIAAVARKTTRNTKTVLQETRAFTFKGVSRLKSPTAYLIKFSMEQKHDVLRRLEPGDCVFTYTAGYASDVFIPGAFKHGITYVGSPMDRNEVGLNADNVARIYNNLPEGGVETLLENFKVETLPSPKIGEDVMDADVIEAVAEGVIFNNLCHLMDTHVNRLLVLRPRISAEERTEALISTFRFLGDKYDFSFNFRDVSAVVCTEVQYHALNGKGAIAFELTRRAGNPTLSADDIVNYYEKRKCSFEFVLIALEDTHSPCHDVKIYVGEDGENMLKKLMIAEERNEVPCSS